MVYSKILVAYDGSQASEEALTHAILLGEYFPSAMLVVLHTYTLPTFMVGEAMISASAEASSEAYNRAQAVVDHASVRIAANLNSRIELIQGNAAETILAIAQEQFFDLIIIGSRGLGGVREFMLGSVSHHVVQHALIPVLVVK